MGDRALLHATSILIDFAERLTAPTARNVKAWGNKAVSKLDSVKERDDLIASEAATQYRTGSGNDRMFN